MKNVNEMAAQIKKQADADDDIAQHIFDNEYKPQMINSFKNEFSELQVRLSKEMLPWIEKRFKDYHVQRYIDRHTEAKQEIIKTKIQKLTHRLILDVIGQIHKIK